MLRFFVLAILLFFTGVGAVLTIAVAAKLIIGYVTGTGAETSDVYLLYFSVGFLALAISAIHSLSRAKDF